MKVCFGNPNTNYAVFKLEDISKNEHCMEVRCDFQAGWFSGLLPLLIRPEVLQTFTNELAKMNSDLKGTATLRSSGGNGPVIFFITVNDLGHVRCNIDAKLDGDVLNSKFDTDQTQLGPLLSWCRRVMQKYEQAE